MAFVVLMITVVPLVYVLNSTLAGATNARQREAAVQLADSWIEILSNSTPPTAGDGSILTNTPQTPTAPAGAITPKSTYAGTNFAVTANYSFQSVNQIGQSDLCTDEEPPSPSHPGVIQLQVKVTWDNLKQSVTDTTNINYPKPGLQTQGFLAVQVTNGGATDVHGNSSLTRLGVVPITVSGGSLGSPLVLNPDPNGCAFAQVPVGTYTLQVGQPANGSLAGYSGVPAFVDTGGNTSETFSESVNVTAETTATVTFDEGINGSVSYGGASAVDGGVTCPGTTGLTCLTLGNGTSNASAAWGGDGSTWTSTSLGGATNLSQVGCTTGSTPTCVGVGYKANGGTDAGTILTTGSNLGTVHSDAAPSGVTDITQVACPTGNGCYALATTSSGPELLEGAVGQTSPLQDTWTAINPPSSALSSLSSIACVPTTTICMVGEVGSFEGGASAAGVLRLDGDPATVASNPAWTPTYTLEGPPPNLVLVGTITCPSASLCLATATGDSTSPFDPTVLSAPVAATGPDNWATEPTFPTGSGSVTDLSCTSTDCVAIGTAGGGPAVWTGDLTNSPHDWAQVASGFPGIPTSVSAVTSVSCGAPSGADKADCVVAATATSQSVPGELLEGSLNGSWAWNPTTAPTGSPVLYYTGLACQAAGSGGSTCAAAGATAGGPVIVTASHPTDNTWNVQTPSSLPGATVAGIPLETSPATLSSWTTQVTQAQALPANATSLPSVLYPFASGYSIVAGDCPSEVTSFSTASLSASPGGTASATVPLGLLPLQVVNPNGSAASGATVRLTSTQCSGTDSYTLPTTDALGVTQTSIPFGTYSYAVNGVQVANTTITVASNLVTVTDSSPSSSTSTYLPGPVLVLS